MRVSMLIFLFVIFLRSSFAIGFGGVRSLDVIPNIPTVEYDALWDLYIGTNGRNWVWGASDGVPWNFVSPENSNPCAEEWQGIRCTAYSNVSHINTIDLTSTNLVGTLSESIGVFSNLTNLLLAHNVLSGGIPPNIGNLSTLVYMHLSDNQLTNTIPETVGNLTSIQFLHIESTYLNGTLPSSLRHLTNVQELFLDNNLLSGPLPEVVFNNLRSLTKLNLANNRLNGTIPPVLFNSGSIMYVNIGTNALTGTLPRILNTHSKLNQILLTGNHLSGTIPFNIGNLTLLQVVDVSYNNISGRIPASIQQLSVLTYLYLASNVMTGTIPPSLARTAPLLSVLDLNGNRFTGPFPENLWGMPLMQFLDIGVNQLTGTLPDTICDSPSLYEVNINLNYFHGRIPATIGDCPLMYYLNLYSNHLTGTLPEPIGALSQLVYLFLSDNTFTGTLPASYAALPYLTQIDVDHNYLVGSIPDITGWYYLEEFNINNNLFSGTLPASISELSYLQVLLVGDNKLHGTIDTLYNSTTQTVLSLLDLNNNQFSGSLPDSLFSLPALNTLSAVRNCFTGTLPSTICGCRTITTIALDGLSSAPACRNRILAFSQAYTVHHSLSGTIPACVFSVLPLLTALHLSGNGLTGTLPGVLPAALPATHTTHTRHTTHTPLYTTTPTTEINPFLVDLSLSHNRLSGTIPLLFQRKKWYGLDLSYNKLSGTLSAEFASENITLAFLVSLSYILGLDVTENTYAESVLSLENNRISGRIPQVLQTQHNISILGTNIFSCNVQASNLPQYDTGLNNYDCGSDSFNIPYYVWLGLAAVCVVCTVCLVMRCSGSGGAIQLVRVWNSSLYSGTVSAVAPTLHQVFELSDFLSRLALYCTLFILVILAPVYILLSHYYGTVVHQYAWMVSAGYITGVTPLVVMFVLLVILLIAVIVSYKHYTLHLHMAVTHSLEALQVVSIVRTCTVYGAFICVNLLCVGGANAGYVYVVMYQDSSWLLPAQLLLSCFKLMWNRFFSIYAIRFVASYTNSYSRDNSTTVRGDESMQSIKGVQEVREPCTQDQQRDAYTSYTSLQVFVALLNNIAIPCFVVAVINPNCFYNVFVAAPAVNTQLTYDTCIDIQDGVCTQHFAAISTVPYDPPFTYSFQCSSSMITSYAPAFVILCIVRTFVTPVLQYTLFVLYCDATPGTWWHRGLSAVTLPVLRPVQTADRSNSHNNNNDSNSSNTTSNKSMCDTDVNNTETTTTTINMAASNTTISTSTTTAGAIASSVYQPYFDANQLLLSLVTYLGILLTFGAVFPPLAVALLCTLSSVVYTTKAKLGRFLTAALALHQLQYVRTVEQECKSAGYSTMVKRSMWMLVTASCWFYTLFLFDTLGDAVGFEHAYWVLIVVPLMPLVLYACSYVVSRWYASDSGTSVNKIHEQDEERSTQNLEMRTTSCTVDTVNVLHTTSMSGV